MNGKKNPQLGWGVAVRSVGLDCGLDFGEVPGGVVVVLAVVIEGVAFYSGWIPVFNVEWDGAVAKLEVDDF